MEIQIKYHADITPIKVTERGDWIDLRAAENVKMKSDEFRYISLGVSNSKILEQLYDLKSDVKMFKQGMPASFLQALIAELAVDVNAVDGFYNNQKNITQTIDNQRMSISGVDLDEEAMDLVKYQNAYNYSAKVITIMNEVFDKLINDMGVI